MENLTLKSLCLCQHLSQNARCRLLFASQTVNEGEVFSFRWNVWYRSGANEGNIVLLVKSTWLFVRHFVQLLLVLFSSQAFFSCSLPTRGQTWPDFYWVDYVVNHRDWSTADTDAEMLQKFCIILYWLEKSNKTTSMNSFIHAYLNSQLRLVVWVTDNSSHTDHLLSNTICVDYCNLWRSLHKFIA